MPKIVNATIQKQVLWIKWNLDDNGGSSVKNVILEWSSNFSNKSLPIGIKSKVFPEIVLSKILSLIMVVWMQKPSKEIKLDYNKRVILQKCIRFLCVPYTGQGHIN